MTELKLQMEMERVDLLAKIEAFNKKAEIVGIEPIGSIGNVNSDTTDPSQLEGKVFAYLRYAEEYLEKMGWERVSAHADEFMKGCYIAKANPNPNGRGWTIKTM